MLDQGLGPYHSDDTWRMVEGPSVPGTKQTPMDALASTLERSPELFPHAWEPRADTVTLVRLSRADYERASFLDGRILGPHTLARTLPWAQLAASVAAAGLEERCQFLFHIGHVGSTLMSRLLGAEAGIFALREPAILRQLAELKSEPESQPRLLSPEEFEARLAVLLKLWSRTFASGQTANIKATSFVSELAAELLSRPSMPKALLLYAKPESYLATILAGANARQEAKLLMAGRLTRLARRLGRVPWRLASLSEGEALAMSWAAEASALLAARDAAGERARLLDFDSFLAAPAETLGHVFAHFDRAVTHDAVERLVAGPIMTRYSKGPEHAYSPALRREVLDDARARHAAEIAKGLAWLEQAARSEPVVARALGA